MKKIFLLGLFAIAWSSTASAQSVAELRWRPYFGCWQLFQESASAKGQPASPGTIVCVAPFESGVKMTTFVDGKPVLEREMRADGATRPVQEGSCPAAQTTQWSRDGRRLFTQTFVRCAGQQPRVTSGIALMTRGGVWFDVQSIDQGDSSRVRIQKYQRTRVPPAGATAFSDAMLALAASEGQASSVYALSLEDVIEASGKTSGPAVEAMVAEVGGHFNINSRTLKQLADAGVSRETIDLMVGKAFPERFRQEQPEMQTADTSAGSSENVEYYRGGEMYVGSDVYIGSWGYPLPLYHDPFYYYYSPYYHTPYLPSMFAYPFYPHRYSNYTTYNYGGPGIGPIGPPPVAVPYAPGSEHGRIVNGRGYVRPQGEGGGSISGQPQGSSGRTTTTSPRGISSRGSSSSGADASSASPSGSSSSSGSSGSSGSSSSSGGGSIGGSGGGGGGFGGGRTAQPR